MHSRENALGIAAAEHCPMHVCLAILHRMQGVSSLVVGTPECCMYSRNVIENGMGGSLHYMYVLDGNEVVFGCEKGFAGALQTMKADGAKAVFVIKTCLPSLIGEGIEDAVDALRETLDMPICVADFAHYKYPDRHGVASGFVLTYQKLVDLLTPQDTRGLVTVLGEDTGDAAVRAAAGLDDTVAVNRFAFSRTGRTVALALSDLSASAHVLVMEAQYVPMAMALGARFQIPYTLAPGVREAFEAWAAGKGKNEPLYETEGHG